MEHLLASLARRSSGSDEDGMEEVSELCPCDWLLSTPSVELLEDVKPAVEDEVQSSMNAAEAFPTPEPEERQPQLAEQAMGAEVDAYTPLASVPPECGNSLGLLGMDDGPLLTPPPFVWHSAEEPLGRQSTRSRGGPRSPVGTPRSGVSLHKPASDIYDDIARAVCEAQLRSPPSSSIGASTAEADAGGALSEQDDSQVQTPATSFQFLRQLISCRSCRPRTRTHHHLRPLLPSPPRLSRLAAPAAALVPSAQPSLPLPQPPTPTSSPTPTPPTPLPHPPPPAPIEQAHAPNGRPSRPTSTSSSKTTSASPAWTTGRSGSACTASGRARGGDKWDCTRVTRRGWATRRLRVGRGCIIGASTGRGDGEGKGDDY